MVQGGVAAQMAFDCQKSCIERDGHAVAGKRRDDGHLITDAIQVRRIAGGSTIDEAIRDSEDR